MEGNHGTAFITSMQARKPEMAQVNLGIDFGTSYTKLCYRIRGRGFNEVKVAPLEGEDGVLGILPSVVHEDCQGQLYAGTIPSAVKAVRSYRFLKMKLAGMWGERRQVSKEDEAIAAFYIAELIKSFRKTVEVAESRRFQDRRIEWSAKACVPIGNRDLGLMSSFGVFYAKAWELSLLDVPHNKHDLITCYQGITANHDSSPCQGYPEIGAAVYSFLLTRDATPGLYCYLDIGGGTLDCSSFHLKKDHDGGSHIYVYSTYIAELGLEAICRRIGISDEDTLRKASKRLFLGRDIRSIPELESLRGEIQQTVARTLVEMKQKAKTENVWQLSESAYDMQLGGGGAKSPWYVASIENTADRWQAEDALRKHFKPSEVPIAPELLLPAETEPHRHRFAVAYGLTAPLGEETPIQGFPWEFFTKACTEEVHAPLNNPVEKSKHRCACNGNNPECEFCGGTGLIDDDCQSLVGSAVGRDRKVAGSTSNRKEENFSKARHSGHAPSHSTRQAPVDMHKAFVDFAYSALSSRMKGIYHCRICFKDIREKTMAEHIRIMHPSIFGEAEAMRARHLEKSTNGRIQSVLKESAESARGDASRESSAEGIKAHRVITVSHARKEIKASLVQEGLRKKSKFEDAISFAYCHYRKTRKGEECLCFMCDKWITRGQFLKHMEGHQCV